MVKQSLGPKKVSDSTFVERLSQKVPEVQKVHIEPPKTKIPKQKTRTKNERTLKRETNLLETRYGKRVYNLKNSKEVQLLASSINQDIKNMASSDVSIGFRNDILQIWKNAEILKLLKQKYRLVLNSVFKF